MSEPSPKKAEELPPERLGLDAELEQHRELLTVMFVDIVGSTTYFEERGDYAGLLMVESMLSILSPLVDKHGGTVIKTIGDAIMARFTDAPGAVRCGMEMQRQMATRNAALLGAEPIRIRVAINHGYGLVKENDLFGDFVNVAARIEAAAEADEILISPSTYEQVQNAPDVRVLQKARGVRLKGRTVALDLYSVLWGDEKQMCARPPAPSAAQLSMATGFYKVPDLANGGLLDQAVARKAVKRFSLALLLPDGRIVERYSLGLSPVVAGRQQGDICLPDDPSLARQHARFTPAAEGCFIEDLTGRQGVFLRLRESHKLTDGDPLLLGRKKFRFSTRKAGGLPGPPDTPTGTQVYRGLPAAPLPTTAYLFRIDENGREIEEYLLSTLETVIGRTQGTYTFADDYMSSRHARIISRGGEFFLEDLHSTNGSFVAIGSRRLLHSDDIVLLGNQLLKLLVEE